MPMVIYLCFSKVKAENSAHVELLSINYISSALESFRKELPENKKVASLQVDL